MLNWYGTRYRARQLPAVGMCPRISSRRFFEHLCGYAPRCRFARPQVSRRRAAARVVGCMGVKMSENIRIYTGFDKMSAACGLCPSSSRPSMTCPPSLCPRVCVCLIVYSMLCIMLCVCVLCTLLYVCKLKYPHTALHNPHALLCMLIKCCGLRLACCVVLSVYQHNTMFNDEYGARVLCCVCCRLYVCRCMLCPSSGGRLMVGGGGVPLRGAFELPPLHCKYISRK